jgi:hypothetical protein
LAATRLRPALGLTLLLCADPAVSQSVAPPTTCSVVGRVFRIGAGRDTVPVPLADVIVLGMHIRSDEAGRFALTGLPPGRFLVRVRATDHVDAFLGLDLVAGETIHRDFRIGTDYDLVQDSLSALGKWPPALDPTLLEHMRKSHDVRVFRIDPNHLHYSVAPDREHRVGAYPIVSEAQRPARHVVKQLIEALRACPYKIPGVTGGPKKVCEGFSPGIDVRFTHDGVPVDVLLCYACEEMSIMRAERPVQAGDFSGQWFADFARQAFPDDAAIGRLTDPHRGLHH